MAFGGGGIALSRPLVDALLASFSADNIAHCVPRYFAQALWAVGDAALSWCIADLGVPLTRLAGFRQLDVRGDSRLLLQHWVSRAPLLSVHHVFVIEPLLRGVSVPDGIARLMQAFAAFRDGCVAAAVAGAGLRRALMRLAAAGSLDGDTSGGNAAAMCAAAFLGLGWTDDAAQNVTVAVNAGVSVRVWPGRLPQRWLSRVVPVHGYTSWEGDANFSFEAAQVPASWSCHCVEFEAVVVGTSGDGLNTAQTTPPTAIAAFERIAPRNCSVPAEVVQSLPPPFRGPSLRVANLPCAGSSAVVLPQGKAPLDGGVIDPGFDVGVVPCLVRAP